MNKKLKIGVLTQPLQDNYGGLLQAYALKEALTSLGHDVVIINRQYPVSSKVKTLAYLLKRKILGKPVNPQILLTQKQKKIISRHTISFREKYIPHLSHLITDNDEMHKLNNLNFNGYIVGSDQCWRPRYSPYIRNYFLDFAKDQNNIKRISYAASFGVSDWEFNETDTEICRELAQQFDAISVREDSGVKLVEKYLGQKAVHVIDPTMLLKTEDYIKITTNENVAHSNGDLMTYILDKNELKQNIIKNIETELTFKQFEILPEKRLNTDKIDNIEKFVYPTPAKWLRGFQDAKFVITDSFHGTVFSILFNVPFLVIANKNRGVARFESLLQVFGLKDRLITDLKEFDFKHYREKQINWHEVNAQLEKERLKAFGFLKSNLS